MGQKVHPRGFRLGVIGDWDARWYSENNYAELLKEDLVIRKYLKEHLYRAGVSRMVISRRANQVSVDLFTAKPGLIIGRGGRMWQW